MIFINVCHSLGVGFRSRKRTEMVHRPVGKDGAPVNEAAGNRTENARIVEADAVVAHDEIVVRLHAHGRKVAQILVLRWNVRLMHNFSVNVENALADFHGFTRQTDDALDKRLRVIERIPEDDHSSALKWLETVNKFVDENTLLV